MDAGDLTAKKISLMIVLTALGVVLAPIAWFPFISTKAYPGQHLVNALAGVLLGPWWGAAVAILIGIVRNLLGIGTIYAFPGGVPGAVVVGLMYILTSRSNNRFLRYSAALFESVGTVLIGGTLSIFAVAPAVGDFKLLGVIEQLGVYSFLPIFWSGWALSSVPGSAVGYVLLLILDKMGVIRQISAYRPFSLQARRRDRL